MNVCKGEGLRPGEQKMLGISSCYLPLSFDKRRFSTFLVLCRV